MGASAFVSQHQREVACSTTGGSSMGGVAMRCTPWRLHYAGWNTCLPSPCCCLTPLPACPACCPAVEVTAYKERPNTKDLIDAEIVLGG